MQVTFSAVEEPDPFFLSNISLNKFTIFLSLTLLKKNTLTTILFNDFRHHSLVLLCPVYFMVYKVLFLLSVKEIDTTQIHRSPNTDTNQYNSI